MRKRTFCPYLESRCCEEPKRRRRGQAPTSAASSLDSLDSLDPIRNSPSLRHTGRLESKGSKGTKRNGERITLKRGKQRQRSGVDCGNSGGMPRVTNQTNQWLLGFAFRITLAVTRKGSLAIITHICIDPFPLVLYFSISTPTINCFTSSRSN